MNLNQYLYIFEIEKHSLHYHDSLTIQITHFIKNKWQFLECKN